MRSRRGLQLFVLLLGSVAILTGLATVVIGVDSIVGAEEVSGTIDSEMRFYAAWYLGAGIVLLRSVGKVESARTEIRGIAALFFVAGCSRILSWLMVGEPHAVARVLLVIELALPFVIVPWQASVARGSSPARGSAPPSRSRF